MEMTIQKYLLSLISASQNMSETLAYGHGGYEWLNDMRELLDKSEEMLPKMEAEICIKEAEELDAEERYHNRMMRMLYGMEELESAFEERTTIKANRLNRRKQNKKNKSRDRIHGRRHGGAHGGVDFRYVDCNPFCNKHQYEDAMFWINGKHRFNTTKKASAMKAREQEYYSTVYLAEEAKEAKVSEQETTEEEAGNFDDFLWYLINTLSEDKYIMLYSFDNGQSYENHDGCANEFKGVKTKDEVIAELTENLLRYDCEVEVNETEVRDLKGIDFNWDFGTDEYWGDWNGYESFTIIPVSELNQSLDRDGQNANKISAQSIRPDCED